MRRCIRDLVSVLTTLGVGTAVAVAGGADKAIEADARRLQSAAMDEDYLSLSFADAVKKLDKAISRCGAANCTSMLLATLHRDRGVVLIVDKQEAAGMKAFRSALVLDPNVPLPIGYRTKAVMKIWVAAQAANSAASTTSSTPSAVASPSTSAATISPPAAPPAAGTLAIRAAGAPIIMAPVGFVLPIEIEAAPADQVESVKVAYKTTAMEKYVTIGAAKSAGLFVVTIGCVATRAPTTIKFWARGYDNAFNEVAHYGTLKKPGVIEVVAVLPDGVTAPTLPGGKSPPRCVENVETKTAPADESPQQEGVSCNLDADCPAGLRCVVGQGGAPVCRIPDFVAPPAPSRALLFFLGLDGQVDGLYLGSGDDVCRQRAWACSRDGQDVGGEDGVLVDGGRSKASATPATMRILATFDAFLGPRVSIGARVGYAFRGNPTAHARFLPWHLEPTVKVWLGSSPEDGGARPFVSLGAGLGEVDGPVKDVAVRWASDPGRTVEGNQAWLRAGPLFVALGGGSWFHLSRAWALAVGAKVLLPFPTFAPGATLDLGLRYGL